jgi:enhancing lycopene biosynthesis protein 2
MIRHMIRSIPVAAVALAALGALVVPAGAQGAAQSGSERPTLKSEAIVKGDIARIGDLIENAGKLPRYQYFARQTSDIRGQSRPMLCLRLSAAMPSSG